METENLYLYLGVGLFCVLFIVVKFVLSAVNGSRKIEKQTAFLELQGYKRKLRQENAMRHLDNESLASLDSRDLSKADAHRLIQEANRQVREGQFIEERARQEKKERKTAWIG